MKNFFIPALCILTSAVLLCACTGKKSRVSKADVPTTNETVTTAAESISEIMTSAPTTENKPPERVLEPADGTYIFDKTNKLSQEDLAYCNSLAELLYVNHLINSAVVITDNLDGRSPEEYASEAYNELYEGKGSGLLLLINNDTNKDYLLKTGSCLNNIAADAEKEAFYWATRDIVDGDYKTAIVRMMELGEKCPQNVFDNIGAFTPEQTASIQSKLSGLTNKVSVLATTNGTGKPNEEILKQYYARKYKENDGCMIMLDTKSKTVIAYSANELPQKMSDYLKKASELAKNEKYAEAVSLAAEAFK